SRQDVPHLHNPGARSPVRHVALRAPRPAHGRWPRRRGVGGDAGGHGRDERAGGVCMSPKVRPIPEGYATVTPYLITSSAARAIQFYPKAFGATEVMRFVDPKGRVGHAEIRIGDSRVMLADEFPDHGARSPRAFGGSPVSIHLYVEDVDAMAARATAAGAKVI